MARLSEREKAQLQEATRRKASPPPRVRRLSSESYVAFATFVSSLKPVPKPVRFEGNQWKL